ncbi:uracil-DNA glycosylase [Asticcacaulis sp. BYS171W]|uniref:Uracil-DNA glycosylase n=1 Tax=Asticcacaulis aquaticus TaxID=2984212 RepID=A0ABT5HXZ2_9CAUL|nr:uracil-DNA glycosylase [Asticcacaulis aquaticus]MDC7684321.1 uracil-DNA glycosylase [Asticcacaulis aquaticus]
MPPSPQQIREWESYLSFLSDHELEDTFDPEPTNRLLAENKSRFAGGPANSAQASTLATVTPLPIATRVNALRPENLKNFNLDQAVTLATALASQAPTIEALYTAIDGFADAPMRYEGGKGVIRGRSATQGEVLIIGEVPDADEDEALEAFTGKPGRLVDAALKALGLTERATLLPGLFWRPAGSRPATDEDVALTAPFMTRLIELSAPKTVILLGGTAIRVTLGTSDSVQKLRGKPQDIALPNGTKVPAYATFPAAFLLTQPLAKKAFWADFLAATASL